MEFPLPLRTAIEQKAQDSSTAELIREAQGLSQRYREESGQGKRLVTTDRQAFVYAAVRMPATFGAVAAALEHTLPFLEDAPTSLLARLGQSLMSAGSEPLQTARWIPGDLTDKNPLPARAGLVSAAYVLNEVREEDRPAVLLRLWAAAEDVLLLIEPGTPEGFRQLRAPSCWPPARTKNRVRSPRTTGAILPVGSPAAGCTGNSKVRMLLTKMKNSVIWLSAGQRATGRFPASCAILRLKAAGLPCAFVPGQVSSPCRCENGTVHCLNPPEKQTAGMLFLSKAKQRTLFLASNHIICYNGFSSYRNPVAACCIGWGIGQTERRVVFQNQQKEGE